jgi:DNA-binding SARP family transcriptional activator
LWEGGADECHSLRQSLATIQHALGQTSRSILSITRVDVAADATAIECDAVRFEAVAKRGRISELEEAARPYAGPLLDGLEIISPRFDAWLTAERQRVALVMKHVLERLSQHYTLTGALDKGVAATGRLVALDPFDEEARRQLMLLYSDRGQGNAAIDEYRALATILDRELHIQPERETRQLYQLLLRAASAKCKQSDLQPRAINESIRLTSDGRPATRNSIQDPSLEHSVIALEQVPACIILTNTTGEIVGWNSMAQKVFGYKKREVLGKQPGFLLGSDQNRPYELIASAIEKAC